MSSARTPSRAGRPGSGLRTPASRTEQESEQPVEERGPEAQQDGGQSGHSFGRPVLEGMTSKLPLTVQSFGADARQADDSNLQSMEEDDYSPSAVVERPDRRRYRRSRPSPGFTPFLNDDEEEQEPPSIPGWISAEGLLPSRLLAGERADVATEEERNSNEPGGRSFMELETHILGKEKVVVEPSNSEQGYEDFADLLREALAGRMSVPDLLLEYSEKCFELSQRLSDMAEANARSTEAYLLQQKAKAFHSEAATWSLLWYLYGRVYDDTVLEGLVPPTSQEQACRFVTHDETAQLCMRIVEWLESLAARDLDHQEQLSGGHMSQLAHLSGVWVHSKQQRGSGKYVDELDPDAPTREERPLHPEDLKPESMLMRAVWALIRAGRLPQARQLCRDTGQAWRAASLGGCGEAGPSPAVEAFEGADKQREEQAVELESGQGRQRRLWKFAAYYASKRIAESPEELKHEAAVYAAMCSHVEVMLPVCHDWEAACWAICRAWLDAQVDEELREEHEQAGVKGRQLSKHSAQELQDHRERTLLGVVLAATGAEKGWPAAVASQQPKDWEDVFQKLATSELLPAAVKAECRQQQREVQRCLILRDWAGLIHLLRQWVTSFAHEELTARPPGLPSTLRFAVHLVLILRLLLEPTAGLHGSTCDVVVNMYASQLLAEHREELVGLYAAQMKPQSCLDFYSLVLRLRQNDSLEVRRKILESALEELPFDGPGGSVTAILDNMLAQSRSDGGPSARWTPDGAHAAAAHRALELQRKGTAVEWLTMGLPEKYESARPDLCARAIFHSNLLLREFALAGLSGKEPVAEAALSAARELLKWVAHSMPPEEVLLNGQQAVPAAKLEDHLREQQDWAKYYGVLACMEEWKRAVVKNRSVPPSRLSYEEKTLATTAAADALDRAFSLLKDNGGRWLAVEEPSGTSSRVSLHVSAALVVNGQVCAQASGSLCEGLADALLAYAGEEGHQAQLEVRVRRSPADESLVNMAMHCQGTTTSSHEGAASCALLARLLAAGITGELPEPARGVALQVARLDVVAEPEEDEQAEAAVRALCRRCCVPVLAVRCMQMKVELAGAEGRQGEECSHPFLEEIAASPSRLHDLFTQKQLQELLLLEREATLRAMERDERMRQESEV